LNFYKHRQRYSSPEDEKLITIVVDIGDQNRNTYNGFFFFFCLKGIRMGDLKNAETMAFDVLKGTGKFKLFSLLHHQCR